MLDGRTPFAQWLLVNSRYGPVYDAPADDSASRCRARLIRYREGEVHIVGMTIERAVDIAIAALDKR